MRDIADCPLQHLISTRPIRFGGLTASTRLIFPGNSLVPFAFAEAGMPCGGRACSLLSH
jgi:hypothetical protein